MPATGRTSEFRTAGVRGASSWAMFMMENIGVGHGAAIRDREKVRLNQTRVIDEGDVHRRNVRRGWQESHKQCAPSRITYLLDAELSGPFWTPIRTA